MKCECGFEGDKRAMSEHWRVKPWVGHCEVRTDAQLTDQPQRRGN